MSLELLDRSGKLKESESTVLVEGLALAMIIGGSAIATWLAKNKYQPEIERCWKDSVEAESHSMQSEHFKGLKSAIGRK